MVDPTEPSLEPITAARVALVVIPRSVLAAIRDEQVRVSEEGGVAEDVPWPGGPTVPGELVPSLPARMRIDQLDQDPGLAAWLVRAIVSLDDGLVVGHLGGHGAPEDGIVEIGYTVAAGSRGQGFATEAARAWFGWAHAHGATRARISTTADNAASLAIVRKLGLGEVGSEWDEDDQVWELVHEVDLPLSPRPPADDS